MLVLWLLISFILGALPLGEWLLLLWPGGRPVPRQLADRLWRIGLEGWALSIALPFFQGWMAVLAAARFAETGVLPGLAGVLVVAGAGWGAVRGSGRPDRCLATALGAAAALHWPAAQGALAVWLGILVAFRSMGAANRFSALTLPAWLASTGAGWSAVLFGLWAAGVALGVSHQHRGEKRAGTYLQATPFRALFHRMLG